MLRRERTAGTETRSHEEVSCVWVTTWPGQRAGGQAGRRTGESEPAF